MILGFGNLWVLDKKSPTRVLVASTDALMAGPRAFEATLGDRALALPSGLALIDGEGSVGPRQTLNVRTLDLAGAERYRDRLAGWAPWFTRGDTKRIFGIVRNRTDAGSGLTADASHDIFPFRLDTRKLERLACAQRLGDNLLEWAFAADESHAYWILYEPTRRLLRVSLPD